MAGVRKVKGSMTVEMVLVFPIILFIIIAFLFFTMYLHDRMIIQCVMDEGYERFNQSIKQPTNYSTGVIYYGKTTDKSILSRFNGNYSTEINDMKFYMENWLKKRMMLSEIWDIQVKKGVNDVKVTINTRNRIPFLPAVAYLNGIQKRTYEIDGGIYNPSEYARAADVSLNTLSQTQVYDRLVAVVEKLNKVVG